MKVQVKVPIQATGDILSDISSKKGGRILNIDSTKDKFENTDNDDSFEVDQKRNIVNALIPLSSMVGYSSYLRQITKGEGNFTMSFSHYEKISGL